MSNATRGAAFERKVRDEFLAAGWAVQKAGASLGCADLWCIEPVLSVEATWNRSSFGNAEEIAFVQCKLAGPGDCPPAEWNALFDFAMRYGGVPLIAHRPKRGRIEYLRVLGHKSGIKGARPPVDEWRLPVGEAA